MWQRKVRSILLSETSKLLCPIANLELFLLIEYDKNYYRVTAAASDTTDTKASFSNYGTCVDLIAPVSSIRSEYFHLECYTSTGRECSLHHPQWRNCLLFWHFHVLPSYCRGHCQGPVPNWWLWWSSWHEGSSQGYVSLDIEQSKARSFSH